jgi:hypothetical protein
MPEYFFQPVNDLKSTLQNGPEIFPLLQIIRFFSEFSQATVYAG